MSISFIVPTLGRPTLAATLNSIDAWMDDEIIVVGNGGRPRAGVTYIPCLPGNDWGCTERTIGIERAKGDYLAFIDDDDVYTPGHRVAMRDAIDAAPDRPTLFRMIYPHGFVLWHRPELRCGNVSTQMILIPNDKKRLGRWTTRREGDFDFLASMKWPHESINWRPEIVARLGR